MGFLRFFLIFSFSFFVIRKLKRSVFMLSPSFFLLRGMGQRPELSRGVQPGAMLAPPLGRDRFRQRYISAQNPTFLPCGESYQKFDTSPHRGKCSPKPPPQGQKGHRFSRAYAPVSAVPTVPVSSSMRKILIYLVPLLLRL